MSPVLPLRELALGPWQLAAINPCTLVPEPHQLIRDTGSNHPGLRKLGLLQFQRKQSPGTGSERACFTACMQPHDRCARMDTCVCGCAVLASGASLARHLSTSLAGVDCAIFADVDAEGLQQAGLGHAIGVLADQVSEVERHVGGGGGQQDLVVEAQADVGRESGRFLQHPIQPESAQKLPTTDLGSGCSKARQGPLQPDRFFAA